MYHAALDSFHQTVETNAQNVDRKNHMILKAVMVHVAVAIATKFFIFPTVFLIRRMFVLHKFYICQSYSILLQAQIPNTQAQQYAAQLYYHQDLLYAHTNF